MALVHSNRLRVRFSSARSSSGAAGMARSCRSTSATYSPRSVCASGNESAATERRIAFSSDVSVGGGILGLVVVGGVGRHCLEEAGHVILLRLERSDQGVGGGHLLSHVVLQIGDLLVLSGDLSVLICDLGLDVLDGHFQRAGGGVFHAGESIGGGLQEPARRGAAQKILEGIDAVGAELR